MTRGEGGVEKRARAAALKYDPREDPAPTVKALGKGLVAQRIVDAARAAGVPVYEDGQLAEALGRLRIGDQIPQELFDVVAEMLAYIAAVDTRLAKHYTGI